MAIYQQAVNNSLLKSIHPLLLMLLERLSLSVCVYVCVCVCVCGVCASGKFLIHTGVKDWIQCSVVSIVIYKTKENSTAHF